MKTFVEGKAFITVMKIKNLFSKTKLEKLDNVVVFCLAGSTAGPINMC